MINGGVATALGALNAALTIGLDETREGTLVIDLTTSAFVGTVSFEGSLDGTNWWLVQGTNLATGAAATTATAAQTTSFNVSALAHFRARVSAYSSGSMNAVAALANRA